MFANIYLAGGHQGSSLGSLDFNMRINISSISSIHAGDLMIYRIIYSPDDAALL